MTDFSTIKARWMKDPDFRREYEALHDEFQIAAELIRARTAAGMTQRQVAERMGTTQSTVARLESGGSLPSLRTIERYARATGMYPSIKLMPMKHGA